MSRKQKPIWEPGYNGHVYWLGKKKLGKVTRHAEKDAKQKYTWEAAGRAGGGDDLDTMGREPLVAQERARLAGAVGFQHALVEPAVDVVRLVPKSRHGGAFDKTPVRR